MQSLAVRDLRLIQEAELELSPGLNLFVGNNAQGKTTLLEAAAVLARGRSFRTEQTRSLIRHGCSGLEARGTTWNGTQASALGVAVDAAGRRFSLDGREVEPARYQGRFDVVVYATDRLGIVRGAMRERRAFLDRGAGALWPAYRQTLREYQRILEQRNAALAVDDTALSAWDERLADAGARLRLRRAAYAGRLAAALLAGFAADGESYTLWLDPEPRDGETEERERLLQLIAARRRDERRARRSLVGPHRDQVLLAIGGTPVSEAASSGQARSLLLALTLAAVEVSRQERGTPPAALLDDLDSELDEQRTAAVCRHVAERGQALVTTAHPAWAERLPQQARRFRVEAGQVRRLEG